MPDDAAAEAGAEGAGAAEKPKTTTSGAQAVFQNNAWLTAAAVAVYTTKALWVKLRKMSLKKGKKEGEKDAAQEDLETEFDEPQPLGLIQTQVVST